MADRFYVMAERAVEAVSGSKNSEELLARAANFLRAVVLPEQQRADRLAAIVRQLRCQLCKVGIVDPAGVAWYAFTNDGLVCSNCCPREVLQECDTNVSADGGEKSKFQKLVDTLPDPGHVMAVRSILPMKFLRAHFENMPSEDQCEFINSYCGGCGGKRPCYCRDDD